MIAALDHVLILLHMCYINDDAYKEMEMFLTSCRHMHVKLKIGKTKIDRKSPQISDFPGYIPPRVNFIEPTKEKSQVPFPKASKHMHFLVACQSFYCELFHIVVLLD